MPLVPVQYGYPVKRPGVITNASWSGSDALLYLQLDYINENGAPQSMSLKTTNATQKGDICVPSGFTVQDIDRDTLVASIRMGTMIGGFIPGSKEWLDAMTTGQDTANFQMAIGTVKIKEVRIISDTQVEIDCVKSGTSTPVQTIVTDFNELGTYSFAPETQLRCAAGALKKNSATSGYVHNYPTTVLSQQQKDDIAAYVLTLPLWV